MSDLADFLLARIMEEESRRGGHWTTPQTGVQR